MSNHAASRAHASHRPPSVRRAGVVNVHHRAKDVRKTDTGYIIELVKRDGNNYTRVVVAADTVVLATPPVSLRQFSVAKLGLNPVLFSVHQRRLCHAYVKCKGEAPDTSVDGSRIYRSVPDSIVQQIVSGDYGQGVFQAAYACDRFERVWRELQFQGPDVLKKEIETQLARLSSTILPQLEKIGEIESIHLCNGFVHRWHIVSPTLNDESCTGCLDPPPTHPPT